MGATILIFPHENFRLKEELKEKIIEILEISEDLNSKVYMNTLYGAPAITNICQDRSLITEAVEDLRDDGYIHVEDLFSSIRLTGRKFEKQNS